MPVKEPRRSRRRVSAKKKPSTALSHEAEIGVKWRVKPRVAAEPGTGLRVLVDSIVIQDSVDDLARRNRSLDRVSASG